VTKLYRVRFTMRELQLITLVVMGTDCTCSCKSSYHTITSTTVTQIIRKWNNLEIPGTLVSATNKIDCHDITEILLKVALNTVILTITLLFDLEHTRWRLFQNTLRAHYIKIPSIGKKHKQHILRKHTVVCVPFRPPGGVNGILYC
jgi:hypothetical protein